MSFQINFLQIVFTRIADCIGNCTKNEVLNPLSGAMIRERLRWQGHVLWMNEDKLSKIVLFSQPCTVEQKAGRP